MHLLKIIQIVSFEIVFRNWRRLVAPKITGDGIIFGNVSLKLIFLDFKYKAAYLIMNNLSF